MARLYWANALFSDADRAFNAKCVEVLRRHGFDVFLPQESVANREREPSEEQIFRGDTTAIFRADCLVAVLDQETIDAGVATEIGLAYSAGIPIVGLYTDIRQHRAGSGHMYKNLYVIGAIKMSGGVVVPTLDGVVRWVTCNVGLPRGREKMTQVSGSFGKHADTYNSFVSKLESWYKPPWTPEAAYRDALSARTPNTILDFGCGPGRAFHMLRAVAPTAKYLGFDRSPEIIAAARGEIKDAAAIFTSDFEDLSGAVAGRGGFDVVVTSFVLHDCADPLGDAVALWRFVGPSGLLLIMDLGVDDLPRLRQFLISTLACPLALPDRRLSARFVSSLCSAILPAEAVTREIVLGIDFPSADAINTYLELFDIYGGCDMPLGLTTASREEARAVVLSALQSELFPWPDVRAFKVIAASKSDDR